jgi:aminopeptidase N
VQHPAGWPLTPPPVDVFSVAQPTQVTTRHLVLDLTVDFSARQVRGSATLHIENLTGTRTLLLDAERLNISRITLDGGAAATYSYTGNTLNVAIEPATKTVTIEYSSNASGDGLFWHIPDATFGGKAPFLYTQNEAIDARNWIPIQDTPTVRLTYDATIRVPPGMLALMPGTNNARAANESGVYTINMPYKVPIYLLALVVGRLEYRAFDLRTGVYAEPELIEAAEWELQYLPEMLATAERIAGPFPFVRHDVAVMPPGYIVGGMEHPMLNTVTPSFLTHSEPDPVQPSSLIAHELAHSWAGDSSTLATWNDVWLNEGITSYLTWRILEETSGFERAEHGWFSDRRNYANFVNQVQPHQTVLHIEVEDPWQGFSSTGYVKGALFMKMLEDRIGRATFDAFLRRYCQIFAFRWVDDQNFLALLRAEVLNARPGLEVSLRLSEWLYEPGIPSNITAPTASTANTRAIDRATLFNSGTPMSALDPASWKALDIALFLQFAAIGPRMADIDAALRLSARVVPPSAWMLASIRNNYAPGNAAVDRVLASIGPRGTIIALYRELVTTAAGRERAQRLFNLYGSRYDPQARREIEAMLAPQMLMALRSAA